MNAISTLTGMVSAEALGIVAFHEHLLYGLHGWHCAPESKFDRAAAFEEVARKLADFKRAGGGTLVDMSGISLGRNVPFYKRLSEISGVRIVASTGFGRQETSIPAHFRGSCFLYRGHGPHQWKREIAGHFVPSHVGSKEYLMFLFYNELTEGMVAPGLVRTGVKAGLAKTGSSWNEITLAEELALRGAAIAARKSGAALFVDGAGQVQRLLEIVKAEGLSLDRVVLGHRDDARACDLIRDKEFATRGAYVAYDRIGWEDETPQAMLDARRIELVKEMIASGFTERVLLSCSAIGCELGMPASRHAFSHLLNEFVPRLAKSGVSEEAIHIMLVENPKRVLTFAQAEDEELAERIAVFTGGLRSFTG